MKKKMSLKVEDLEERIAPTIMIDPIGTLFVGTDLPNGNAVNDTAVSNGGPWNADHGDNGTSAVSH